MLNTTHKTTVTRAARRERSLRLIRHRPSRWSRRSRRLAADQTSTRRRAWLLSTAGGPPSSLVAKLKLRRQVSFWAREKKKKIRVDGGCSGQWVGGVEPSEQTLPRRLAACRPRSAPGPFGPAHWSAMETMNQHAGRTQKEGREGGQPAARDGRTDLDDAGGVPRGLAVPDHHHLSGRQLLAGAGGRRRGGRHGWLGCWLVAARESGGATLQAGPPTP